MKSLLALALLLPSSAFASKLVNQDMRQYFPSVGLGSTQSVAYNALAASTAKILSPSGSATELVSIVVSSAAFVNEATVATSTSMYIPANTPTILEVLSGDIVSAVQVNSSGTLFVTHLTTFPNGK